MAQTPSSPPQAAGRPSTARRWWRRVPTPSIVAAVALAIFIAQNTKDVTFRFVVVSFTWPLWLYTVVVAVLGALLWLGLGAMRRRRRRKEHPVEHDDRRA